jgi:hypothetical protein
LLSLVAGTGIIIYWLWTGTAIIPEKEFKDVGLGLTLPIYISGPQSVSWWAMFITMLAVLTAYICLVFGYFFFWTVAYFVLFGLVTAIGGFLVTALGIIPIKASSGHWPVTRWFLQFSKQRSVATHTLGMETPALDDARLVLSGAGAYETNCRACHGSPSLQNPRVAQAMLPRPPYLPHTISRWDSVELFYIVKHGIKFTGMPAWPSQQRDDEVWAMVAFLQKFPELDVEGYRRLVDGEAPPSIQILPNTTPPSILERCARCVHSPRSPARILNIYISRFTPIDGENAIVE